MPRTKGRKKSKPFARFDMQKGTVSLGAAAAGDDFLYTLFDVSATGAGAYVVIRKMTIQWFTNFNSSLLLYVAVIKDTESAAAPTLDSEVAVRNLMSDGKMLRNLGVLPTKVIPGGSEISAGVQAMRKTIVLEKLRLDPDDDLKMCFTTVSTSTGTNNIEFFVRTWWRSVA